MDYVLAIDIGVSSGRHILGWIEDGKLKYEEIYRFQNGIENHHHHDTWNLDVIVKHILHGMRKCAKLDKIPKSVAIDTWACDFVLCDEDGKCIGDCISYRDKRCDGIMEEAFKILKQEELYSKTGIQFQKFNSLYQLLALRKEHPEHLRWAKHFLMIPDYLSYVLCGIFANEYTNATTTQLVNAHTGQWDEDILNSFALPRNIFHPIQKPGTSLGHLRKYIQDEVGYDCEVILCASHDTGSAFAAVSLENEILISSGTWSLLGVLLKQPLCEQASMALNFTNEGGCYKDIRFLKNIMGLWMIQEVQRQYKGQYSFSDLMDLASEVKMKTYLIDVEDNRFLYPKDMILEIQMACKEQGTSIPYTPGEIAWCIYSSLAHAYGMAIHQLETLTQKVYNTIHIFGGGCQNTLLSETVERLTSKRVIAGPVEATAIGNLMVQLQYVYNIDKDRVTTLTIQEIKERNNYE